MRLNLLLKTHTEMALQGAGGGEPLRWVRSPGASSGDGVAGGLNAFDTSSFWFSFRSLFSEFKDSLPGSGRR